jgi:hypothetical protein
MTSIPPFVSASTFCGLFDIRRTCRAFKFMHDSHGQTEITAVGVKTQSFIRFDHNETLKQICNSSDLLKERSLLPR